MHAAAHAVFNNIEEPSDIEEIGSSQEEIVESPGEGEWREMLGSNASSVLSCLHRFTATDC